MEIFTEDIDIPFRFARGEGAGVVVLKLLEDAIRDGDHIYASVSYPGHSLEINNRTDMSIDIRDRYQLRRILCTRERTCS